MIADSCPVGLAALGAPYVLAIALAMLPLIYFLVPSKLLLGF
jgi:hypothetical protein